jgi:hypothetical protein
MASIISFTFREAVADVEYKGKHVHCGGRGAIHHRVETLPGFPFFSPYTCSCPLCNFLILTRILSVHFLGV